MHLLVALHGLSRKKAETADGTGMIAALRGLERVASVRCQT